uniref:Tc1-like transposase DDE domain-containing protein n=1 Tax=Labrus bergylta TaxID=56723 RepID=A0A3Q3EI99_9LABR
NQAVFYRFAVKKIWKRLHTANLRSHMAAIRPAMTALHRQACLRWCRQQVHWNLNMWRNIMFSDESRFCLLQLDHRVKVWRRSRERYAECCNSFWWRLVFIGGNLNADRYRDEILQPVTIPYLHSLGPNSILQDEYNLGVEKMEWPACSPDLNPIEHLRNLLGPAVHTRGTNTTTLADLLQMLVEEWDAIPQPGCCGCHSLRSLPRKM